MQVFVIITNRNANPPLCLLTTSSSFLSPPLPSPPGPGVELFPQGKEMKCIKGTPHVVLQFPDPRIKLELNRS